MRNFLILFLIGYLVLVIPTAVLAQNNFNSGKSVSLPAEITIGRDYFAAGQNVTLDGRVNGDAYVIGGDVTLNGTVDGDLIVAGGYLNINGTVKGSIRGAGGNIFINGTVEHNVSLAGGNITVSPGAKVIGSISSAGGNLNIQSPVGRAVNAAGGQLRIAGTVGGDINAAVAQLSLAPGTRVKGDVTYWSQNAAEITPEASVSGRITHNIPPQRPAREYPEVGRAAAAGFFTAVRIFGFFSALIAGFIIIKLLPVVAGSATETVSRHWLKGLGIGLLALAVTPALVILLLVTVIGIPLAGIWLAFLAIDLWLSKIFVSLALGSFLSERFGQKWNSYLVFTFGLLVYFVIGIIPVVGGLFNLIAGLIGLGAIVLTKRDYYLQLSQKKLL